MADMPYWRITAPSGIPVMLGPPYTITIINGGTIVVQQSDNGQPTTYQPSQWSKLEASVDELPVIEEP